MPKLEAEGTVDQIVGSAQRTYGKVKDKASGAGTAVADQLDDISAVLGDTVAERPLTALLVAGAIGYVLARLIRR
ncbi:MAG: CsbD family protein [Acetobacteraceae bacterium]